MNLLCKGEAWKKGFMFHASCFMFEVSSLVASFRLSEGEAVAVEDFKKFYRKVR